MQPVRVRIILVPNMATLFRPNWTINVEHQTLQVCNTATQQHNNTPTQQHSTIMWHNACVVWLAVNKILNPHFLQKISKRTFTISISITGIDGFVTQTYERTNDRSIDGSMALKNNVCSRYNAIDASKGIDDDYFLTPSIVYKENNCRLGVPYLLLLAFVSHAFLFQLISS